MCECVCACVWESGCVCLGVWWTREEFVMHRISLRSCAATKMQWTTYMYMYLYCERGTSPACRCSITEDWFVNSSD